MNPLFQRSSMAALLLFLCSSCGPSYRAYLKPDGGVSVVEDAGMLSLSSSNLWIAGSRPGEVTPARDLAIHETTRFKGTFTRRHDCDGYVDRTREGTIEVRLCTRTPAMPPFARPSAEDGWRVSRFSGTHTLIPDP